MTPQPQIYYKSEKECNEAALEKRKEMQMIGNDNRLIITGIYSNCIKDTSKPQT